MKTTNNFPRIIPIFCILAVILTSCQTTAKLTPFGMKNEVKVIWDYPFQYFLEGKKADQVTILEYYGTSKNVVVPEQIKGKAVRRIHNFAFANKDLIEVTLPETIWQIRSGAFANNKLTNITIPEKVSYIGQFAFHNNPFKIVTIEPYTGGDISHSHNNYAILGSLTATYQMNGGLAGIYTLEDTSWKLNGTPLRNYTSIMCISGDRDRNGHRVIIDSIDGNKPKPYKEELRVDSKSSNSSYFVYTWYYIPVGEHTIVYYYVNSSTGGVTFHTREGWGSQGYGHYQRMTMSDGFYNSSGQVTTTKVFDSENYYISFQKQGDNISFDISVTPLSLLSQ